MRIGLISDTHDNVVLARAAAEVFRAQGVDRVFHLGDVTDPETLAPLDGLPLVVLRGNNDDEEAWPMSWRQEFEGVRVGATHGHVARTLRDLIADCDVVLHGHTHRRRAETVGRALVVNPGALHRASEHTVATLELPSRAVRFYELG